MLLLSPEREHPPHRSREERLSAAQSRPTGSRSRSDCEPFSKDGNGNRSFSLLRPTAVSILLNLALMTSANAGDDVSIIWRELFERCRVAVETGKEFDATGLHDLGRSVSVCRR